MNERNLGEGWGDFTKRLLASTSNRRELGRKLVGNLSPYILPGLGGVGLLILLSNLYRKITDSDASAWTKDMEDKLLGIKPLSPEERFVSRVRVVAAGSSLAERTAMTLANTPVNVRDYPSTTLFRSSLWTKVIGTLRLGAEIDRVILIQDGQWGVFSCGQATGWVKPPEMEPGRIICAVNTDYLTRIDN